MLEVEGLTTWNTNFHPKGKRCFSLSKKSVWFLMNGVSLKWQSLLDISSQQTLVKFFLFI